MKLNRKWVLIAALVLSVVMVTSGTLAYLTDAEQRVNTFTVGDVDIDLTEPNFPATQPTLLPGVEIPKDPQITNTGNTNAWVWMKITLPTALYEMENAIVWNETDWTKSDEPSGTNTIVTMKHKTKLAPNPNAPTNPVFEKVSIPATTGNEAMDKLGTTLNIVVDAFAIQDHASFEGKIDKAMAAYGNNGSGEGGNPGDGGEQEPDITVNNSAALASAIANGNDVIALAAGDYTLPEMSASESDVVFIGADGAKITSVAGNNHMKNVTFENIEFTTDIKSTFVGNCLIKECTFTNGTLKNSCYVDSNSTLTIEGCDFVMTEQDSMLHFGGNDNGSIVFKGCTFKNGRATFGKTMNVSFQDGCDFDNMGFTAYGPISFTGGIFDSDCYVTPHPNANVDVIITMNGCSVEGGADIKSICKNYGNTNNVDMKFVIDGTEYWPSSN